MINFFVVLAVKLDFCCFYFGGDWRIRTAGFTVLQTVPLDHSGTSPLNETVSFDAFSYSVNDFEAKMTHHFKQLALDLEKRL